MRIRTLVITSALVCAGAAPGSSQVNARDTALASMVAAEHAFQRQAIRGTTQSAFVANMSDTGLLYRPRAVRGLTYLRHRPMPADLALVWETVFADVSAAGPRIYDGTVDRIESLAS